MDVNHVRRIQSNVSQMFSSLDSNCHEAKDDVHHDALAEDVIPPSLLNLSTFPMLNEIVEKKSEIARLENELNLKPLLKEFDKTQGIVCKGVELSQKIAHHLEYLVNSSQVVERALKDPMIQDALPLPHHLHRKTIEAIEACIWMVQHKRWSPLDYEVEWDSLLPKLQADVTDWVISAKQSEKDFKELQDLKQKLDNVLENYHSLKV